MKIEKLVGFGPFRSASALRAPHGRKIAELIRRQPGYRRGSEMIVCRSSAGGMRLYTSVAGRWMDASLEDLVP